MPGTPAAVFPDAWLGDEVHEVLPGGHIPELETRPPLAGQVTQPVRDRRWPYFPNGPGLPPPAPAAAFLTGPSGSAWAVRCTCSSAGWHGDEIWPIGTPATPWPPRHRGPSATGTRSSASPGSSTCHAARDVRRAQVSPQTALMFIEQLWHTELRAAGHANRRRPRWPAAGPRTGCSSRRGFSIQRLLDSPRFAMQKTLLQLPHAEPQNYTEQVTDVLALIAGTYRSGRAGGPRGTRRGRSAAGLDPRQQRR